jgi:hypothetical protein
MNEGYFNDTMFEILIPTTYEPLSCNTLNQKTSLEDKIKNITTTIEEQFQNLHKHINVLNKNIEDMVKIYDESNKNYQDVAHNNYPVLNMYFRNEVEQKYNKLVSDYKNLNNNITFIYNLNKIRHYFNFQHYKEELVLIHTFIESCIGNYNNVKDYTSGLKKNIIIDNSLVFTYYESI